MRARCSGPLTAQRIPAFRRHRPPLRLDEVLGGLIKLYGLIVIQTVWTKFEGFDQRPMDDEVTVTPNRAGKVRVFFQVETKVPDIVGAIDRLALRP